MHTDPCARIWEVDRGKHPNGSKTREVKMTSRCNQLVSGLDRQHYGGFAPGRATLRVVSRSGGTPKPHGTDQTMRIAIAPIHYCPVSVRRRCDESLGRAKGGSQSQPVATARAQQTSFILAAPTVPMK